MKSKLLSLLLLVVTSNVFSQNLVVNSGIVTSTSLVVGDIFNVAFDIRNIWTSTSAQCYSNIYIGTNTSGTNLISLGFVSCPSLAPNGVSMMMDYKLPLPYTISSGTYYVYVDPNVKIATTNAVYETDYTDNLGIFNTQPMTVNSGFIADQYTPYPIIFVHGLSGSGNTWWDFGDSILGKRYGQNYGGQLSYCLNQDANNCTGGSYVSEVKDWTSSLITKGDYYLLNFAVDNGGVNYWATNDPILSNQSGIIKQGYAIRLAINKVKAITGKQKVILVGHSMGGLACREYIQNPAFYQNDVAKLVQCATPNKGSDAYFPLGYINNKTIDWKSEAQRDLKNTYDTGYMGSFLFGGNSNEDNTKVCECGAGLPFYNVDVNCDGNTNCSGSSYQAITGLNSLPFPDINYSCVIGYGDNTVCNSNSFDGDDVVEQWSANLYGVLSTNYIDTFKTKPRATYNCTNTMHCDMTKYLYNDINIQALDEPDYFDDNTNGYGHAYGISTNTLYYGVIAKKNKDPNNSTGEDYDDYKFSVSSLSNVSVHVCNINVHNMSASVWDATQNLYSPTYNNNSNGNISFYLNNVPAGTYYLEIKGMPTSFSWYRPYGFQVLATSLTGVNEYELANSINIFPNPSSGLFAVQNNDSSSYSIKISNVLGEKIFEQDKISVSETEVDLTSQENGIYFMQINSEKGSVTKKIVVSK